MNNIKKIFDIIVCGGGSAGFAIAVTAARQGVDVLLVEQFNCFGGTATTGLNFGFERSLGMNSFVYKELYERMTRIGCTKRAYFNSEAYKYASKTRCCFSLKRPAMLFARISQLILIDIGTSVCRIE